MHLYTYLTGQLTDSTADIPGCSLPVVHIDFAAFDRYAKTGFENTAVFTGTLTPVEKQELFRTFGFVTATLTQKANRLANVATSKKSGHKKVSLDQAYLNKSRKLFVLHIHDDSGELYAIMEYTERLTHHRDGRHGAAIQ